MVYRTPFFLPWFYPGLVWRMPALQPNLYLTFDDGPIPGPTEFVLETLNRYKIHATFFCIGDNVQKHPELFQRVVHEGHAIGNHTFNHFNGWRTSTDEYIRNTEKFDAQVAVVSPGFRTTLFRPPYGRITQNQIRALPGYRIIMWDVLTNDYSKSVTPERCLAHSLRAVRNGSIIVFHDSLKAEKNLRLALPRFIEFCLNRGFTFHLLNQ